jgi:hypothetical protein
LLDRPRATATRTNQRHMLSQLKTLTRHSPESRMARYRNQLLDRRMMVPVHIAWFCACILFACVPMGIDVGVGMGENMNIKSLAIAILMTGLTLAGGDLYELVRDAIENWVFCPKYDRASQPRPKFEIKEGLGPFRLFIYVFVTPALPATGLWLLHRYGLIRELPQSGLFGAVEGALLLFGLLRYLEMPTTLRALFKPFKRIPSPDCH